MKIFLPALFFVLIIAAVGIAPLARAADSGQTPISKQGSAEQPYADMPEEYIQEASQFFNRCQSGSLSQYYNCQCLAVKYLDARISKGPHADKTIIFQSIRDMCTDASGAAGQEYQDCVNHAQMYPANIPIEKYCSCYASTYTKLFERGGVTPNSAGSVELRAQAHLVCENPTLARQLYPNLTQPDK